MQNLWKNPLRRAAFGLALVAVIAGALSFGFSRSTSASEATPGGAALFADQAAPGYPVAECFRQSPDSQPLNKVIQLKNSLFGNAVVGVTRPDMFCEWGLKYIQLPNPPGTPGANTQPRLLECFRTVNGNTPNLPITLSTNNFGVDKLYVTNSDHMCETALKQKDTAVVRRLRRAKVRPRTARCRRVPTRSCVRIVTAGCQSLTQS